MRIWKCAALIRRHIPYRHGISTSQSREIFQTLLVTSNDSLLPANRGPAEGHPATATYLCDTHLRLFIFTCNLYDTRHIICNLDALNDFTKPFPCPGCGTKLPVSVAKTGMAPGSTYVHVNCSIILKIFSPLID